jgi:hypothetical protein
MKTSLSLLCILNSVAETAAQVTFLQSEPRRNLAHVHLQKTPLYGNSTELEYFYITAYFGSHRQAKSLIFDTESSVAAIPCSDYCSNNSCGSHINGATRFPLLLPESCSSAITKIINADALMVTDVSFIKAARREAYTTATS